MPIEDSDIQRLLDEREIHRAVVLYATAVDGREWELMNDVFVADVEVDFGHMTTTVGIDACVAVIRATEDKIKVSQHLLGNHAIDVDGDTATSTTKFQAQHYSPQKTGPNTYQIGGTYHDRLRRTDAGWRITHRYIEPTWYDGNAGVFSHVGS